VVLVLVLLVLRLLLPPERLRSGFCCSYGGCCATCTRSAHPRHAQMARSPQAQDIPRRGGRATLSRGSP
jgi:hypothetical protein